MLKNSFLQFWLVDFWDLYMISGNNFCCITRHGLEWIQHLHHPLTLNFGPELPGLWYYETVLVLPTLLFTNTAENRTEIHFVLSANKFWYLTYLYKQCQLLSVTYDLDIQDKSDHNKATQYEVSDFRMWTNKNNQRWYISVI